MKVALFGGGRMGKIHAANLFLQKGIDFCYIVEQDQKIAQELSQKFHCQIAEADEVFADAEIKAIFVTTPTPTHLEIILQACQTKKHIFCEKPLASNVEQAKQIVDAVEKSGVLFLTAFNRRFDPSFYKLKQELTAGKIGKLFHLLILSRDPEPAPIDYLANSGGLVRDMMIHDLDMALWILGEEITEINAIGGNLLDERIKEIGDIDTAYVTLKTASGKVAQIVNSRACASGYDQRIEAFGEKGLLTVGNHKTTQLEIATKDGYQSDKAQFFFLQRYQEAYRLELQHFCDSVKNNTPPSISAVDGLKAIQLAERIMQKLPQIKL